ncbi:hypothetical protein GUY60_24435 [Streptomyces sp. YC537]|uniref:WxL domain-containing protein n=1 Tax=Streptomyces boluensis TaxID=1775135 RepID=A0A964USA6_9ACTN|nr:hypothetical protein [Streptomyces boluensis]
MACAVVVTAASAQPAAADTTQDTTTTFAVTATDGINITAPASATLTDAAPGATATGQLTAIRVNDQRSALDSNWTATVSLTTPFTTGGGTASETIGGANVDYDPGTEVNPVNGPFTAGSAATLAATRTAFSRTSGSGDNAVSWTPTVSVRVPANAVAGTYTGTLRHSVA